ncbi:unnamed protein product, partial [Trichobilharzia szidati]
SNTTRCENTQKPGLSTTSSVSMNNINSMASNCSNSIPIFDYHHHNGNKTSNSNNKSALLREQFFSSMLGDSNTQQHQPSLESELSRKPKVLLQYGDL